MNKFQVLGILALTAGCGAESNAESTPYAPGDVTVIGVGQRSDALHFEACEGNDCDVLDERCGERAAGDIIVNEDGEVVDVLCYPLDVHVDEVQIDQVPSASAGNNTVLVLDDIDDGLDVSGDVTIEGNNAVVYGHGADVSAIGGTLRIQKNNAIVRGVRIQGDVTITKNNTQLAYCVIEGDLTITGNNTTVAECTVHGELTILGLNTVLVQNDFERSAPIEGFNLSCNDNRGFAGEVEAVDAGVDESWPLTCVQADGPPAPQSEP